MPCLLKIKVFRARNLPAMDRKSSLTDAYVEIRFADAEALRTNICKKSLNPVWNEDFRLEVGDDISLQDEPLELRVVDYDSITYDDLIGSVFIDLNVLLMKVFEPKNTSADYSEISNAINNPTFGHKNYRANSKAKVPFTQSASILDGSEQEETPKSTELTDDSLSSSSSSDSAIERLSQNQALENMHTSESEGGRSTGGWFPIFDTQNGIRGELQCQIKLEFFGDVNPFKESSAGIRIFSMDKLPFSHDTKIEVCGFLSAIITINDPEYHWSDNFRTQRTSNESRQRLLYQISGQLRRKMGKKAIEAGANIIVGYKHSFDLEEKNKTVTARAVGTAILINRLPHFGSNLLQPKRVKKFTNKQLELKQSQTRQTPFFKKNPVPDDQPKNMRVRGSVFKKSHNKSDSTNDNGVQSHIDQNNNELSPTNQSGDESQYLNSKLLNHVITKYSYSDSDAPQYEKQKANRHYSFTQTMKNDIKSNRYLECDILTLKILPPSIIYRLGGAVMAHSVKVIENDEEKTRQSWWDELRKEIKNHAKSLGCTHVIGYSETAAVYGDVVALSVSGTAAVLDIKSLELGILNLNNGLNSTKLSRKGSNLKSLPNYQINESQKIRNNERLQPIGPTSNSPLQNQSSIRPSGKDTIVENNSVALSENELCLNMDLGERPKSGTTFAIPKAKKTNKTTLMGDADRHTFKNAKNAKPLQCRMCHVGHNRKSLPYPMRYYRCGYCQNPAVPEIVLSTTEIPQELDIIEGEATIVEAHICRPRGRNSVAAVGVSSEKQNSLFSSSLGKLGFKRPGSDAGGGVATGGSSEAYAAFISDILPFIQYDLHRQLLYKLSVYGMNAIFGLCYHLSLGDEMVIATAIGTAVYATALPTPGTLVISRNIGVWDEEDRGFLKLQDRITSLSNKNRSRLDKKFRKKIKTLILKNKYNKKKHTNKNYLSHKDKLFHPFSSSGRCNIKSDNKEMTKQVNSRSLDEVGQESFNSNSSDSASEGISARFLPDKMKRINNSQVHSSVAVQIDDDADEDLMAALFDHPLSQSFKIINTNGELFFNRPAAARVYNDDLLVRKKKLSSMKLKTKGFHESSSASGAKSPISTPGVSSGQSYQDIHNRPGSGRSDPSHLKTRDIATRDDFLDPYNSYAQDQYHGLLNESYPPRSGKANPNEPLYIQSIVVAKRINIDFKSKHPNRLLANLFNHTYQEMCSNLHYYSNCLISGLHYSISNVDESLGEVQLLLTATAIGSCKFPPTGMIPRNRKIQFCLEDEITSASSIVTNESIVSIKVVTDVNLQNGDTNEALNEIKHSGAVQPVANKAKSVDKSDKLNFTADEFKNNASTYNSEMVNEPTETNHSSSNLAQSRSDFNEDSNVEVLFTNSLPPGKQKTSRGIEDQMFAELNDIHSQASILDFDTESFYKLSSLDDLQLHHLSSSSPVYLSPDSIELTKLCFIPGHTITSMMGRLTLHFVKEVSIESNTKGPVGMPGFALSFINDVNACIRSQIEALRGNALICMSIDNQQFINSKSSAYAIFSISGDVVFVEQSESQINS